MLAECRDLVASSEMTHYRTQARASGLQRSRHGTIAAKGGSVSSLLLLLLLLLLLVLLLLLLMHLILLLLLILDKQR